MPHCTHTIIIILKMIQANSQCERAQTVLIVQVFVYVIVLFHFIYSSTHCFACAVTAVQN